MFVHAQKYFNSSQLANNLWYLEGTEKSEVTEVSGLDAVHNLIFL